MLFDKLLNGHRRSSADRRTRSVRPRRCRYDRSRLREDGKKVGAAAARFVDVASSPAAVFGPGLSDGYSGSVQTD